MYKDLKKSGEMPEISAAASFRGGAVDINTWLLFIQYACCFGVELTVNNAAVTYFVDRFELEIESASAIASIFGFMVRTTFLPNAIFLHKLIFVYDIRSNNHL